MPRIAWEGACSASASKVWIFRSIRSGMASTTRSASDTASFRSVVVRMRARAASRASAAIFPFSVSLARLFSMWAIPRSSTASSMSRMATSMPAVAQTWAMP